MKRIVKLLFPLVLLIHANTILSSCCSIGCCEKFCELDWDQACEDCCVSGYPFFKPRAQHWNLARTQSGWQTAAYAFEKDKWSFSLAITPEYTRSFKPYRVSKFFFGDDLQKCGKLFISGSRKGYPSYEARESYEWLADYFGLPPDFQSIVRFAPRTYNFITDFSFHIGMDGFSEGLFLEINAPVVYAGHAMNMCETFTESGMTTSGVLGFENGYMSGQIEAPSQKTAIGRNCLPADFTTAIQGCSAWGDLQEPLKYGKISPRKLTRLRLADLRISLGRNIIRGKDYQCGLMIFGGLPTGNKPCAEYLFEPIAGNGGHFELGFGVTGYNLLWKHKTEQRAISIYFDGRVAHLFKSRQWRSFDLKNNPNSRYMLIEEMKSDVENLFTGAQGESGVAPSHQYAGKLFHLINKTTCCTDVKILAQGEIAVTLKYTQGNFSFDFGYDFWARSGETFCNGCTLPEKKYALKGDAHVYGFDLSPAGAYPLSATESKATVNAGTNTPTGTAWASSHTQNPSIDNAQKAWLNAGNTDDLDDFPVGGTQINTSLEPIFISTEDLDTCESPSALSHKIFAHFNYAWADRESTRVPFLGVGGEIEWAGKHTDRYSTLSQWGIWVKGGVSFE